MLFQQDDNFISDLKASGLKPPESPNKSGDSFANEVAKNLGIKNADSLDEAVKASYKNYESDVFKRMQAAKLRALNSTNKQSAALENMLRKSRQSMGASLSEPRALMQDEDKHKSENLAKSADLREQLPRPVNSNEDEVYDQNNFPTISDVTEPQVQTAQIPLPSENLQNQEADDENLDTEYKSQNTKQPGFGQNLNSRKNSQNASKNLNSNEDNKSVNVGNFNNPEFRNSQKTSKGFSLSDAKQMLQRGKTNLSRTPTKAAGDKFFGDKRAFLNGSDANRQLIKDKAKDQTKQFVKDKMGNIAGEGFKKGLKQGLEKGAGKAVKEGAKKVAKEGLEQIGKQGLKQGTKLAVRGGIKAAQGAISGAGAATGAATFGLGLMASFLLNIAIELGINDAVDAGFELAAGNVKQATFLAIRAGTKVGMFIVLLVAIILNSQITTLLIGIPLLIVLDLYAIAGKFFTQIPQLQGFVRWELIVLGFLNIFVIINILIFISAVMVFVCTGAGMVPGWLSTALSWIANSPLGGILSWASGVNLPAVTGFCQAFQL